MNNYRAYMGTNHPNAMVKAAIIHPDSSIPNRFAFNRKLHTNQPYSVCGYLRTTAPRNLIDNHFHLH